ncbi:phenylacetate--CoA ligase family protein [Aquimarina sp. MMG016]|uniref:phenylacetate--CoA ligase family protein n=1 Tax=Aquimarina sp. MMG016 TaxID=2822690 RepID=UPI001B3A4537|nr:phenylacetate--CoA ligase family protein [Aquimarina sp. MMG016]MBQ4819561.1 phenylacetate--CoA ligase family protein [Aquimarina sp. MMG016]
MGKLQEKIYNSLPYPFKFLLLNVKAYQNTKQRYTKEFDKYLKEYIDLWDADIDVILLYQKEKLTQLLSEAYEYSDWYSKIMKELGITSDDISLDPYAALAKMSILQKAERKSHPDQIVNKQRNTDGVGYTSGTSGAPTINYLDSESIHRSFALWRRFHKAIGLNTKKVRQVRFSGRLIVRPDAKKARFWVYNYFERQLLMSTYHLTENNLPHYIKKLNRFKPKLLDGYPSAIYIISRFINENNITLDFTPKAIAVTAETLYDYQRLEIEKAFGCQVFNQYASSEGSPFITECVQGNLHLNLDSGVFEFINTKGETANPGDVAQLVVTSFTNLKTPLIRYSIGDTVLLAEEGKTCNCRCSMPIIEKLTGREDDILWTEEKGYVGRMDTAYKGLKGIIKSQIIQESPKEIVVNLIANEEYNAAMQELLLHNLQDRLGQNVEYQINTVNDIPLGPNGKFDAVKRNFEIEL